MKKTDPQNTKSKKQPDPVVNSEERKIYDELEIQQRTQKPPSEELIAKLNQIASQPPFSYTQKKKENDPL